MDFAVLQSFTCLFDIGFLDGICWVDGTSLRKDESVNAPYRADRQYTRKTGVYLYPLGGNICNRTGSGWMHTVFFCRLICLFT